MEIEQYKKEIIRIKDCDTVYIYGAGDVAKEVYFGLSKAPYSIRVDAFLVSTIDSNTPHSIEGLSVVAYDDEIVNKAGIVIISVLEKYRDEICELLDKNGIKNRILMTFESDLWSEVRSKSYEYFCKNKNYPYIFDFMENKLYDDNIKKAKIDNCKIYVTRSMKDKPLSAPFCCRDWEKEILAGAVLDNADNEYLRDDAGDNISNKNRQYCELTAMYWIWKNTNYEYVGLSHYRRRFNFSIDEINKICNGYLDVMLTMPIINVPSVKYMYDKNHDKYDWKVMKEVLKDLYPEYMSTLEDIESSNYYIPYNMFIMKRKIFYNYCNWLFPVLEQCEKIIGKKDDTYQNRYIGFLAERLMTVYFDYNKDKLKIAFCNKHFLE